MSAESDRLGISREVNREVNRDPTPEISRELARLQEALEVAHRAGLDSIGSGDVDAFASCLSQLGQQMAQTQSRLAQLPSASTPAAIRLQLERLRTSMDALLSLNDRLSAQAQRALAVLFPADQVKAYSRLGGRSMGSVGSGNSYLKA